MKGYIEDDRILEIARYWSNQFIFKHFPEEFFLRFAWAIMEEMENPRQQEIDL